MTSTHHAEGRERSENVSPPVVRLDWHENEMGQLVVVPKDNDRFVVKVRYAVDLLQKGQEIERFREQLTVLLKLLAKWLCARDDVQRAYITVRDGALSFVVVKLAARYDAAFEDELSELDLQIANDPDLESVSVTVLSLPPAGDEAISAFLDEKFTMEFRADGSREGSHRPG